MTRATDNPILNSPYEQPGRYYEIGPHGPTGEMKNGRCPCESLIPIAVTKKGKEESEQDALDFDATGERRERNSLINDIRRDVAKWRRAGEYAEGTPITRKLLQHWADADRETVSSSPSGRRPRP
jgi:type III restriction enzyme